MKVLLKIQELESKPCKALLHESSYKMCVFFFLTFFYPNYSDLYTSVINHSPNAVDCVLGPAGW